MNLYEHTIIARQDTSPSELKQLTEKYSKIVEKNDGEVIKTENWGLLNLSYLIKKNKKGSYIHFKIKADGKIISELEINSSKNIVIHPQFSKQKIIFGYPDDLDEKFEKINLFYKKIVPAKGWNTYRTVNVKFKNQIICDKS